MARRAAARRATSPPEIRTALVLDVGGTHVKMLVTDQRRPAKFDSGPSMTVRKFVTGVRRSTRGWSFDAVSIGYPGPVVAGRPASEPPNLGGGWVGFDFERAFHRPVRIVNDAAMQALGSYRGGRMLFLGFGTGLGSALIVDGRLEPLELAHLPYRKNRTFEDYVGERGLLRMGKKRWRKHVAEVVQLLDRAFQPEYIVLGGGNAVNLREMPPKCSLGSNDNAFAGGAAMWGLPPPALARSTRRSSGRRA